jgi:hypothetical protein
MSSKKSSKKKKKGGSSSSKDEKKALKYTKKYYDEKKADINTKAATDTTRLAEDLTRIMAESGLAQNRATEDYIRNIGNIEANKGLDVAQLNDYVATNTGRTQEDLDIDIAKETRRFTLESDQINQNLADAGRTFSDRTEEKTATETSRLAKEGINMDASRSFQDIARYETAKNAEIQNRYGQQTEQATTTKTRTLEDILNEQQQKAQQIQRGQQDVAFGKAIDIRDTTYNAADAASTIGNYYDSQANSLTTAAEKKGVLG